MMIENRRLRAPARHGEVLIDPPLAAAEELVEQNSAVLREAEIDIAGRSLADLAAEARSLLLQEANKYTAAYRDVDAPGGTSRCGARLPERILLAGHQPQLFHPGVLFKNFALAALANRLNAAAVNLVIDNDAAGPPSLRVLAGSTAAPTIEAVPFDQPAPRVPYEERRIADVATFRTFGRRVHETIRPFVANPIIEQLWPYAIEALKRTDHLGRSLAQARHRLEADWGLQTLELPLSCVARTEPFAWFVAFLLRDLPRFVEVHNQSLRDYRRAHRLRSRTHPVPDLAAEGEWREAPFWVWSADDPVRRHWFVRRVSRGEIELTDRRAWRLRLPLAEEGNAAAAVERLLQLARQGVKLRPRALMTTLYARLFLGDLFLHGIGGAKYDELTDALVRRFFGLTPPAFYAVTATVLLPVPRPGVSPADVRRIEQQLRELRFHPEQHLDGDMPDAAPHAEAKRRWLSAHAPSRDLRERHRAIESANAALQPFVEPLRERLEQERKNLSQELNNERLLGSREFSFCLFPKDELPALLHHLIAEQNTAAVSKIAGRNVIPSRTD
jgi:hypothetical protein